MKPLNFEKIKEKTYIQYELRLREEREAGKREGIALGEGRAIVNNIRLLIENGVLTADQAIKILQVPEKEQDLYLRLVNDPAFYEEYFSEADDDYDEEEDLEEE